MSKVDQISGNQKRKIRSATRLYIIQALFQMEQLDQSVDQVAEEFITHRFAANYEEGQMLAGDETFFKSILEAAVKYQASIDQLTDRALVEKWPIDRIDPTLRSLFDIINYFHKPLSPTTNYLFSLKPYTFLVTSPIMT